jgi:hypothetical protein
MLIDVTTANICGNPLRPKWAVRRRMRRALAQPGVVFGQEVARSNRWRAGNYSAMWQRVARVYSKATIGGPREVPISVPQGCEVISSASHLAHNGRKRVSPNRYITEVRCRVGGELVAFLNCHPVSKPRRGVPAASWRIVHWDEYHSKLAALVAGLHDDGYTVVFGGDMNKARVPVIHPAQQVLIQRGLDHLWAVAAEGMAVTTTKRNVIGRTALMDHPILTATFDLKGKA